MVGVALAVREDVGELVILGVTLAVLDAVALLVLDAEEEGVLVMLGVLLAVLEAVLLAEAVIEAELLAEIDDDGEGDPVMLDDGDAVEDGVGFAVGDGNSVQRGASKLAWRSTTNL